MLNWQKKGLMMNDKKDIKNSKPVRGEQLELKQSSRTGNRRKRPEKSSGSRWTGLFLFIVTLLVSLFFYLKGGK